MLLGSGLERITYPRALFGAKKPILRCEKQEISSGTLLPDYTASFNTVLGSDLHKPFYVKISGRIASS